ncbi:MAG: DUF222 domain-containing protein [bacterium]|nr:DUF222 domain-containing protein [bacterium]
MFATSDVPNMAAVRSLEWLETALPGPQLAAQLAEIDTDRLSAADRVSVLVAHHRMVAHYQARAFQETAILETQLCPGDDPHHRAVEDVAVEIGAALHLTRRAAETETHLALELARRLPDVLNALLAGNIDLRRARTLVHGTEHLPDHTARRVVDQILDDASGLTTGQLAAAVRRLGFAADPDAAALRYRRSLNNRRVVTSPNPDGTANLYGLDLPTERIVAFSRYLNRAAQDLHRLDKTRTIDQLRADILVDILEGTHTHHANPTGGLHIHIGLTTLIGLDDQPAELAGFGPVIADIARQTAKRMHDNEWAFTVTDEATGKTVCEGTTQRRPTPSQRRHLQTRYRHCVWPGCRMPSIDCDLDHNRPHAEGGCRHNHNLAPLCRYHHTIRHNSNWTYHRLPNNDHHWTSPLGRTYTTSGRSP